MSDPSAPAGPDQFTLEIRLPDGQINTSPLTQSVTIGRDQGDIALGDPASSRRHASITPTSSGVVVEDLGSSNGTWINGVRIEAPTLIGPPDVVRIGDTEIQLVMPGVVRAGNRRTSPAGATIAPRGVAESQPTPAIPQAPGGPPMQPGDASESNDSIEVRFRPASAAAQAVPGYLSAAQRARTHLSGFGSEPWGAIPVVHLVDPFPDPSNPQQLITSGALVDGGSGQAWVVVTAESPPEDPHRALALLFGFALPNAERLGALLEGYGLLKANESGSDPAADLDGVSLPDFDEADPDTRAAMTESFVRFLIDKEDDDVLRRLFGAPAGQFDATFRTLYGAAMPQLEARWRRELSTGEPEVKPAEFLRLSWRYLKPYKVRQTEVFGYMLMSLAFTAAFPFVTQRLFDTAIPSGEFSQVLTLLIGLAIAFTISLLASVRQNYQSSWITGAVTRDLRAATFERLQVLPSSWYHHHPQGDVLARLFSDVGQVQAGLTTLLTDGIFQLLTLVVSAIIMLKLNLPLGLLVLAVAPLVAVVYRKMSAGALDRSMALQESNGGLLTVAAENYQANPVVRVFGLGTRENRRFGQQAERLFRDERKLTQYSNMFGLSVNMIVTSLRLVVLGLGAWFILEGRFTLGGLVAFLSVMGEVLGPVTSLTGLGQSLQSSMGSLIRVDEVLDADPEPAGEDLPAVPAIQRDLCLANVNFSYTPAKQALSGVSVTIPAGSRVAFVGPSGSGKSTILRLLMRLYEPDEGAVLVDGLDLGNHSLSSWRNQIGVVFQDSFLFDATLAENIALGKLGATEDDVRAAARDAEVDEFVSNLTGGYDNVVGEGGQNLSGGQRQRVAIARALIRNPAILLLDEATSALDPRTERQITETLRSAADGRTVVSITHRLTSIADFDNIVVIDDGEVVEQGNHEQLMAERGLYAEMWVEQTGDALPEQPEDASDDGRALLRTALGQVVLFEDLSEAELDHVAERIRPFTIAAGTKLDDPSGFVVVLNGRGQVLVRGRPSGAQLDPGDAFGVVSFLGGQPSTLSATTDMTLGHLDADTIAELAEQYPLVATRLSGGHRVVAPASSTRLGRLTTIGPAARSIAALTGENQP